MATHSSVLAWRIPGTEEPGGLPSMGSQSRTRLSRGNLVQQPAAASSSVAPLSRPLSELLCSHVPYPPGWKIISLITTTGSR